MDNITEIKFCKNKKCRKVLPEDYKYKYCEACMNKLAYKVRETGKKMLSALTAVPVVVYIIQILKNEPKSE